MGTTIHREIYEWTFHVRTYMRVTYTYKHTRTSPHLTCREWIEHFGWDSIVRENKSLWRMFCVFGHICKNIYYIYEINSQYVATFLLYFSLKRSLDRVKIFSKGVGVEFGQDEYCYMIVKRGEPLNLIRNISIYDLTASPISDEFHMYHMLQVFTCVLQWHL